MQSLSIALSVTCWGWLASVRQISSHFQLTSLWKGTVGEPCPCLSVFCLTPEASGSQTHWIRTEGGTGMETAYELAL